MHIYFALGTHCEGAATLRVLLVPGRKRASGDANDANERIGGRTYRAHAMRSYFHRRDPWSVQSSGVFVHFRGHRFHSLLPKCCEVLVTAVYVYRKPWPVPTLAVLFALRLLLEWRS